MLRYQQINSQLNKKCEELRVRIERVSEEKDGTISQIIEDMGGKDVKIRELA